MDISITEILEADAVEILGRFCERWNIDRLEIFGSAVRGEMRKDSDLDILVSFGPNSDYSLFDMARMEEELEGITGRRVDLISRLAIEQSNNWIRRREILNSARLLYAA